MHDLVTLGEILLRLAIPSPARFETARQLDVQIGGAEANVAAACARLGLRVAWISSLPANQWGERARHELTGHGVDCGFVHTRPDARMGLYFVEYGVAPGPGRVRFYRPRRRFNVQLVDPLGAGDAYVAGFLWAVLGKRELQEAVEIGNAVAALKCSIWGDVALVTPRDVEEVLADGPDVRR